MSRIKVKYFAVLRELLDNTTQEEYTVEDGIRLMDLLLKCIPARHPDASRRWKERVFDTENGEVKFNEDGTPSLRGAYHILINGRSYLVAEDDERCSGLEYRLKAGDEIAILPPVGGG